MMPCQYGSGQVVEIPAASPTMIFLAGKLGVVSTLLGHGNRVAMRTLHPIRPARLPHLVVTLGIIQQVLKMGHLFAHVGKVLAYQVPHAKRTVRNPY